MKHRSGCCETMKKVNNKEMQYAQDKKYMTYEKNPKYIFREDYKVKERVFISFSICDTISMHLFTYNLMQFLNEKP